jgi:MHS family citrate/tricarballylate:H+ symporter-like MFS transporter
VISTALISATGDKAAPAIWMAVGGLCGLVATILVYRERGMRMVAAGQVAA